MGLERVARRIDELRDETVDFLARICAIPALGPENNGTGELEKYAAVLEEVRKLGPDREVEIHAPDERVPDGIRPNLLAVFNGRDSSRTVWILTHVDVVPPGDPEQWDHDPFDPKVVNGLLYGRGVSDNGQSLAASILAVRAVKETVGLGLNAGLAIVSDEETGSRLGLDYVLEHRLDMFMQEDLILVPDAGNEEGTHVEVAEKHLYHVKFHLTGSQGHASRPDLCRNTLRAAAHLVVELDKALPVRFPHSNDFFNPAVSTFEPTRKDANVPNINTIPGEDVLYFDCRILPEVSVADVFSEMKNVAAGVADRFNVEIEAIEHLKFEAPEPTPPDCPVVIELAQAIQEIIGVQARPVGIGGQTVAAFFRKRGLHAAAWQKAIDCAHAPNERISIDDLALNAKVFARMMM